MENILSLKAFVGSKDYQLSLRFYEAIGWKAAELTADLSELSIGPFSFFLQRYYEKKWCDNTMMFTDVENAAAWRSRIDSVLSAGDYGAAKVKGPTDEGYAWVTHLWDPSGVLWHLAQAK